MTRRSLPGPPTSGSTRGSSRSCGPTPTGTTTSPATRRRGSRRTCTSAASRRSRSRHRLRGRRPAPTRSSASCAGATSTTRSSPPGPTPRGPTTAPRRRRGHDDAEAFAAWQEGRTGYPVVDAGMRQLAPRGLRCTTGPACSWRRSSPRTSTSTGALGARHFLDLPRRRRPRQQPPQLAVGGGHRHRHQPPPHVQPDRAGPRFDPDGDYVRRYVPELRGGPRWRGPRSRSPKVRRALRLPRPRRRPPRGHRRVQGPERHAPHSEPASARSTNIRLLDAGSGRWTGGGQPSAMVATNCWSCRRLRHSKTPSQYLPYSDTIESPVSQ